MVKANQTWSNLNQLEINSALFLWCGLEKAEDWQFRLHLSRLKFYPTRNT